MFITICLQADKNMADKLIIIKNNDKRLIELIFKKHNCIIIVLSEQQSTTLVASEDIALSPVIESRHLASNLLLYNAN